jgi:hypothetical protein
MYCMKLLIFLFLTLAFNYFIVQVKRCVKTLCGHRMCLVSVDPWCHGWIFGITSLIHPQVAIQAVRNSGIIPTFRNIFKRSMYYLTSKELKEVRVWPDLEGHWKIPLLDILNFTLIFINYFVRISWSKKRYYRFAKLPLPSYHFFPAVRGCSFGVFVATFCICTHIPERSGGPDATDTLIV